MKIEVSISAFEYTTYIYKCETWYIYFKWVKWCKKRTYLTEQNKINQKKTIYMEKKNQIAQEIIGWHEKQGEKKQIVKV